MVQGMFEWCRRKAFDTVHRRGLWVTLEHQGVPPRLLAVVRALHEGMTAKVRVGGALSDPFPVREGVRQGCLVAPALLNLYYAAVLDEWRRMAPADIELRFAVDSNVLPNSNRHYRACDTTRVGDTVYADDTTLLAATWESAKQRWHRYVDIATRFGLTISVAKSKVLTAGHVDTGGYRLAADERHQDALAPWLCLEHVDQFPLLGSSVEASGAGAAEIARRLRSAGEAWRRLRPTCFRSPLLGPARRFRIFTTFVLSRLLYGAELWRASKRELRPMRKFYNRCVRAIAGHSWWTMRAKHVHDAELRQRVGAPHFQQLLDRAALRWAGHCARTSSSRIPLQLLMGDVPAWPPRPQGQPHARARLRWRHRITAALRRFGIDQSLFLDAAQDAAGAPPPRLVTRPRGG